MKKRTQPTRGILGKKMSKPLPNNIDDILHDVCTNHDVTSDLNIYTILGGLYSDFKWLNFHERMTLTTAVALLIDKPLEPEEHATGVAYTSSRTPRIFLYHPVHLDAEFGIIVTEQKTGDIVFEHGGNELVARGFMRNDTDIEGLRGFLIHIGELLDDDVLIKSSNS